MNERAKPPGRRSSTTVYLDWDQLGDLRKISEETRVPVAAIVRRGIDLAIERYRGDLRELGIEAIATAEAGHAAGTGGK